MIDRQVFDNAFIRAVANLRAIAPKDTGNLAYNAIKYQWINSNTFKIYVDEGFGLDDKKLGVAPYMPFTNEEWISPKWNGHKNPNQNWWNEAIQFIIQDIARTLGGVLE